ncbi:hypothetical protein ACWGAN_01325 [Streptomyces sp. NPDC054945]
MRTPPTPPPPAGYHGGELPGSNSFIGHDPDDDVTLVFRTNLTLSPDGRTTARAMPPTLLHQICTGLDLPPVRTSPRGIGVADGRRDGVAPTPAAGAS